MKFSFKFREIEKRKGFLAGVIFLTIILPVLLIAFFSFIRIKNALTEYKYSKNNSIAHLSANIVRERFDRIRDLGVSLSIRVRFRELVKEGKWQEALLIMNEIPEYFPF